jgi:hypothetical protein
MRPFFTLSLLIILMAAHFYSCVPNKKVTTYKKDLTTLDSQLVEHSKSLKELDTKRQAKLADNQIDDTANARIQKYIALTTKQIDTFIGKNTILIGDVEVDRKDWNQLRKALSEGRLSSKIIGDKVNFITDLINRDMVVKLEQDVLFQPGKYFVSAGVADAIGKIFEPAAKEIDWFTQKYPDFPLSLVITAKGYADATNIGEGSQLYKDLVESMKLSGRSPTDKELNRELSVKRAESVIDLFKKYTTNRSVSGGNIKNILYLYEGKGESPPDPHVADYKIDDVRRRVVLLFWSIFPE